VIVVLDTNIWVSALNYEHRRSAPILALERMRNLHTIAVCDQIEDEISRVLVNKFKWQVSTVRRQLDFFLARSVRVPITGHLRICRDPNDDMILECAVSAGAETIVSGDQDLLSLGTFQNIRILTPAEFLETDT